MITNNLKFCRITYHGKIFEGTGNCTETARQRAIDKFHAYIGCPTWEETEDMIFEYI